jgi:protein TonB
VFDEVTAKGTGRRAALRGAWFAGSSLVQAGLVIAVVAVSAALARRAPREGPLVPVKLMQPAIAAPSAGAPAAAPARPRPSRAATRVAAPRQAAPAPLRVQAPAQPPPPPLPAPAPAPEAVPAPEATAAPGEAAAAPPVGRGSSGVAAGVTEGEGRPGGGAGPVPYDGSMARPVLIWRPEIAYTQEALDHQVEGTMVVRCILRVDGTVRGCRVLKSLPFMREAVLSSLEQARYQPVRLPSGQPVEVIYTFEIKLVLPR